MDCLRHARRIARLVLAWFALSLGVAIAAPLVQPVDLQVVCSAAGTARLVVKGDVGTPAGHHHGLDCPLCLAAAAPPFVARITVPAAAPLAHAVQPIPAARIAALVAAPLPARGPPAFRLA